jgi:hypothetical protein
MTATIDIGRLIELLWVTPLATAAVALCFSLAIVGVTRAGDCRRADRPHLASAYALLSVVSLGLFFGGVAFAVILIAAK